jgi:hypothetical protein
LIPWLPIFFATLTTRFCGLSGPRLARSPDHYQTSRSEAQAVQPSRPRGVSVHRRRVARPPWLPPRTTRGRLRGRCGAGRHAHRKLSLWHPCPGGRDESPPFPASIHARSPSLPSFCSPRPRGGEPPLPLCGTALRSRPSRPPPPATGHRVPALGERLVLYQSGIAPAFHRGVTMTSLRLGTLFQAELDFSMTSSPSSRIGFFKERNV